MGLEYTLTKDELLSHAGQAMYRQNIVDVIVAATQEQIDEIAELAAEEIVDGVDEIYALDHAVGDVLFAERVEADGNYLFLVGA